ncbi:ethyl tert-butyl ether degradation [Fusarium phyllophilum]|uniref:Ethyl tert-butyl ether degradation n=1 Tax=Fusarium phyllophilum TaxID=47803 RepID=A0A8H5MJV5_9HYPO|nr:ethyl tert-butyl ether degradation [Fusarium phyllophilum]
MAAYMTVLYPNTPEAKIDPEYWVKTHMALVEDAFKPHILSWKLIKNTDTPGGDPPEFSYQVILEWDSLENCKRCNADSIRAAPVLKDIPNYSNVGPKFIVLGELVGERLNKSS